MAVDWSFVFPTLVRAHNSSGCLREIHIAHDGEDEWYSCQVASDGESVGFAF